MPSELQRVAQGLVGALDEIPRVVGYLQDMARRCRDNAAFVGGMSNNPAAQRAAMQLDEAARRCEEAAHYLSQAPPKARAWAEQMVSGARAAEPGPSSEGNRPSGPVGTTPPADGQREKDERGRDLQRRLPVRGRGPEQRPKTRGLWVDDDGQEHDLVSGETDLYEDLKKFLVDNKIGRSDGHLMVTSHVEAKFAMFMRRTGRMHETIAVNKLPCKGQWGCEELLGRILPPGGTLTVFGPDDFKETYPLNPQPERTDPA